MGHLCFYHSSFFHAFLVIRAWCSVHRCRPSLNGKRASARRDPGAKEARRRPLRRPSRLQLSANRSWSWRRTLRATMPQSMAVSALLLLPSVFVFFFPLRHRRQCHAAGAGAVSPIWSQQSSQGVFSQEEEEDTGGDRSQENVEGEKNSPSKCGCLLPCPSLLSCCVEGEK